MAALTSFIRFSDLNFCNQLSKCLHANFVRFASKKAAPSTRNKSGKVRPKHRGCKKQDGHYVQAGTILVLQRTLRFHPGLNVGFGKNGTLFALEAGRVMVTCEEVGLNWEHTWVQREYEGRENQKFYKKYFNVIPKPQEQRFKLIDKI
ncbi:hypothetical protein L9F63_012110 [Diploptera punctata]|uniref:Large ribosomal subunit protein bL27m n=1 Tax=Diploptera punctata TaxID=6984 RepID=A0AAD8ADA0_DIPPU|nr:hypothetical protein L9F63_012110 [Diploptera punctata]